MIAGKTRCSLTTSPTFVTFHTRTPRCRPRVSLAVSQKEQLNLPKCPRSSAVPKYLLRSHGCKRFTQKCGFRVSGNAR